MQQFNWTNIPLKPLEVKKLKIYIQELCHFNKKIPLYSRQKNEEFCWELILDSLLAGKILFKDSSHPIIADIGSGAGFPGVVLAILSPERKFILFEPHQKKAAFLEYITWKMNLKNIQIKNIPVQKGKGLLNCAVSKAFLSLGQRLALTKPCFKKGAFYYHFQSLNWRQHWEKIPKDIRGSWQIEKVEEYSYLPFLSQRVLIKTCRK